MILACVALPTLMFLELDRPTPPADKPALDVALRTPTQYVAADVGIQRAPHPSAPVARLRRGIVALGEKVLRQGVARRIKLAQPLAKVLPRLRPDQIRFTNPLDQYLTGVDAQLGRPPNRLAATTHEELC